MCTSLDRYGVTSMVVWEGLTGRSVASHIIVTAAFALLVFFTVLIYIRFETKINMNSEYTSGKNFMPSWPAVERIILATNSKLKSTID
jgi:hypothetical protein